MSDEQHTNGQPEKLIDWERFIEAFQAMRPEFKEAWYEFKHSQNATDTKPPVSMPENR
jgi:hypothetical protein